MNFEVLLHPEAEQDLLRLYEHILIREMEREGDLQLAQEAIASIRSQLQSLRKHPFICRKASNSPFLRELLIPFGRTGYVALFEVVSDSLVIVAAIRHQREDDYY